MQLCVNCNTQKGYPHKADCPRPKYFGEPGDVTLVYQPSEAVRVVYVPDVSRGQKLGARVFNVDCYQIEYVGERGWQHWAQVSYLAMAKGVADRRARELAEQDLRSPSPASDLEED